MPPPPPAQLPLPWQLALATASGGTSFRYSSSYWTTDVPFTFGDGTDDTITYAFNGILVEEVRLIFNNISNDYTLPSAISGLYTLRQLANGHLELSGHLNTRGNPNGAIGIPVAEQPTSGSPSNSWNLPGFPEADAGTNGQFTECQIGFDMRRNGRPPGTDSVRIGTTVDEWTSNNRYCGWPGSAIGIGTPSHSATYGGYRETIQLPGVSQVYVRGRQRLQWPQPRQVATPPFAQGASSCTSLRPRYAGCVALPSAAPFDEWPPGVLLPPDCNASASSGCLRLPAAHVDAHPSGILPIGTLDSGVSFASSATPLPEPATNAGYFDTFALAVGDVNADGYTDILLGNRGPNKLLLGAGNGTFTTLNADVVASGSSPCTSLDECTTQAVGLADIDGDGKRPLSKRRLHKTPPGHLTGPHMAPWDPV